MGFSFPSKFEDSLNEVVGWTLGHPEWLPQ
jgi:hypothetical protein